MKKKDLVSIIIVNYNGGEVFAKCLKSLQKLSYGNWELIVVDNGSTDNSLELLKKTSIKNIQILQNKVNVGFAPANNQGYKLSKGKYILFLNNDTSVSPDLLTKMVLYMSEHKEYGVIQPKIYLMDKPGFLDNAGSFLNITGFLEHWGFMEKDSPEFNKERIVLSVKGACMFVKRVVIEKVGLFDPDFISYYEETDFCWRAWIAGYKSAYIPNTSIEHKLGFTSKKQSQIFVNYNSFKNRLRSIIKNLELQNLLLIGSFHLFILLGLVLYYLVKLQFSKSWMIMHAILWNISHLPETLSHRAEIQNNRKLSDRQIFAYILKPINIKDMFSHFLKVEQNFK